MRQNEIGNGDTKMPRVKKEKEAINMNIEKGLHHRLILFCKESGLTKTAAVEQALQMYLDDCDRKKMLLKKYDKKS